MIIRNVNNAGIGDDGKSIMIKPSATLDLAISHDAMVYILPTDSHFQCSAILKDVVGDRPVCHRAVHCCQ